MLFTNFDNIRSNVYNLKSGTVYKDENGNIVSVEGTVDSSLFNQFELGVKIDNEIYSLFITGFLNAVEHL